MRDPAAGPRNVREAPESTRATNGLPRMVMVTYNSVGRTVVIGEVSCCVEVGKKVEALAAGRDTAALISDSSGRFPRTPGSSHVPLLGAHNYGNMAPAPRVIANSPDTPVG